MNIYLNAVASRWQMMLCIVLILSADLLPVHGEERILTFPIEKPVGKLTIGDSPHYENHDMVFDRTPREVRLAQGRVTVPDHAFVGLEVAVESARDLSFLR